MFAELGVATQPTEMSRSIRCDECGLQYAGGRGLSGLVGQATNPRFVRMLAEVARFYRRARKALEAGSDEVTVGEFLRAGHFSDYFVGHFMVPVISCVWSVDATLALEFPARYLFTFLDNHGMLSVTGSAPWRTVVGGSRSYVAQIVKDLSAVITATPVRAVLRGPDGVIIRDGDGLAARFDKVVMATHADTALRLLADPTPAERLTLGAFTYSRNETWLHRDDRLLPTSPRLRASWNYLLPACRSVETPVLVSYDMNRLQSLPTRTPHIVTLNATDRIDADSVLARMSYEHPIYTTRSVAAQSHLPQLNNGTTTAFAGSYHGWGFHEDGCRAGVAAAASLGVSW
jgi:uncharacterized protein